MPLRKVLVTGGTGYIGSHAAVQLLNAGYSVVLYDNLSNSSREVVQRIRSLTGRSVTFIEGDIRERQALRAALRDHAVDSIMHFAGLKAVAESQDEPLKYYDNNVVGSLVLLEEMEEAGLHTIVFSSSATVYGDPGYAVYSENTPTSPVNVYGKTKLAIEHALRDIKHAKPHWRIAILRYFNPVVPHASGMIGENPRGTPNNLMPHIAQVASGARARLSIFGDDYPTADGTGARDYVHVEDLVAGHVSALQRLQIDPSLITVNLGTGRAYTVLEMVKAFERVSGKCIPYDVLGRRSGDLAEYYAAPNLAKELFGWEARLDCEKMCADTWRWQQNNPNGY